MKPLTTTMQAPAKSSVRVALQASPPAFHPGVGRGSTLLQACHLFQRSWYTGSLTVARPLVPPTFFMIWFLQLFILK